MKKDPKDRYPSAKELAEEIEHYLADEPVQAYREPIIVRVRRWGRRYRSLVTGMTSLVFTALLGLSIGIFLVNQQRERAESAEEITSKALVRVEEEQKNTQEALAQVTQEKSRTEAALLQSRERFNLALDAFQQMVFSIQEKLDKRPGTQDLKKDLLEKARQGLEKLRLEKTEVSQIDHTTIWSHFRMGDLFQVLGDTKQALQEMETGNRLATIQLETDPLNQQAQRDLSVSYSKMGNLQMKMNATKEALASYQKSIEIYEKIAKVDPFNQEAQRDLSISYDNMGDVQMKLNQTKQALASYQKSLEIREKIAKVDPEAYQARRDWLISYSKLAEYYFQIGNLVESKKYFEKGIQLGKSSKKPLQFEQEINYFDSGLEMVKTIQRTVEDQKEIEKIRDKKIRPTILTQAVNVQLFLHDWTKADRTADYLIEHYPDAAQLYDLACIYSRKILEVPIEQKPASTVQAMKILKKATELGYRDWRHMQKDFGLDSLRELPEFQKLLAELKAAEPELLPLPKLR